MSVKSCAAPGLLAQLPSTCLKPAVPCSGFPNSAVRSTPCTSFPLAFIWGGWEEGVVLASCSEWPGRHSPCGGGTRQMLPVTISLSTESCYRSTLLPRLFLLAAFFPARCHCLDTWVRCKVVAIIHPGNAGVPAGSWSLGLGCNSLGRKASEGCGSVKLILLVHQGIVQAI